MWMLLTADPSLQTLSLIVVETGSLTELGDYTAQPQESSLM